MKSKDQYRTAVYRTGAFWSALGTLLLFCGASGPELPGPAYGSSKAVVSLKADSLSARVDSTRFSYNTLVSGLDEPMEMAILPNYDLLIVERKGGVKLYKNNSRELKPIAHFDVFSGIEDGLLGVTPDPGFLENHWVYFYYSVAGEKWISHLARYELRDDQLVAGSKKVLLEIPTQRKYCCHSAGYLTFDAAGLLYLSIGDNTNAEEIEGHNPTDERPGRELSDGQASTANSNDYRGKILRIKPEPDGTYSIPDGNLFPKDGSKGKPEIYVMGVRNPFRISIDPKTRFLYWGDVGPSTEVPAEEGTLSYDEINQARGPGFFGYPYFLGNNEVFPKYDFATKKEGPGKDPLRPVNTSPHNTGVKELPPARPAFIWYGPLPSKRWPLVGKGGASAMAGPVYYSDLYPDAPYKLPPYYNGKLFIYDWVRRWIMAVTMDDNGRYVSMEPFLPRLNVVAPIDMQVTPDGAIYLLAYGTNWFAKNTDSGIIRIEYAEGNRRPVAVAGVSKTVGAAPLKVSLSASGSQDLDPGDRLSYEWTIGRKKIKGISTQHTFDKPGLYDVRLTVTDSHGAEAVSVTQVSVGNEPPEVTIETPSNKSFYWNDRKLDYRVTISDREDGSADPARSRVSFDYLSFGKDLAGVLSAGGEQLRYAETVKFYETLDCGACHARDTRSIGPSLMEIARKYAGQDEAQPMLTDKIIKGGSGNWGSYPMPPHPHLSGEKTGEIVEYILSLADEKASMPLKGSIAFDRHHQKGTDGAYVLQASYLDGGANRMPALRTNAYLVFRDPKIEAEDYAEGTVGVTIGTLNTGFVTSISGIRNGHYARYDDIDLTDLTSVTLRVRPHGAGGVVSVRLDRPDGTEAGSVRIPAGTIDDPKTGWQEFVLPLKPLKGKHNLYFVFRNPDTPYNLFQIDNMVFK